MAVAPAPPLQGRSLGLCLACVPKSSLLSQLGHPGGSTCVTITLLCPTATQLAGGMWPPSAQWLPRIPDLQDWVPCYGDPRRTVIRLGRAACALHAMAHNNRGYPQRAADAGVVHTPTWSRLLKSRACAPLPGAAVSASVGAGPYAPSTLLLQTNYSRCALAYRRVAARLQHSSRGRRRSKRRRTCPPVPPPQCWGASGGECSRARKKNVRLCISRGATDADNIEDGGCGGFTSDFVI